MGSRQVELATIGSSRKPSLRATRQAAQSSEPREKTPEPGSDTDGSDAPMDTETLAKALRPLGASAASMAIDEKVEASKPDVVPDASAAVKDRSPSSSSSD